jgi:hypothetical protein
VSAESREDAPAVVLTVKGPDGAVIRQVEGPAEAGFHRVAWNLRYPSLEPWVPEESRAAEYLPEAGVLVVPGRYSVEMQHRVDGELIELGQSQSFDVVSIRPDPALPGGSQPQRVVFESQVDELHRAASGTVKSIDAVIAELDAVKETLHRSTTDGSLYALAHSIQQEIRAQRDLIEGNEARGMHNDPATMTVQARLWHARFVPLVSAHGPTAAQQDSLRIARGVYDGVVTELRRLVDEDYAELKQAMDTARVPWTPGRGIQE